MEPLCEKGGIGKNFYEIIRSSREFVKGMGSGRGEGGREGGWDGEISSAGGRNGCFATREFPLALFLIKVHQSRIFLSRFDALYLYDTVVDSVCLRPSRSRWKTEAATHNFFLLLF